VPPSHGAHRAIFINSAGEHSDESFCGRCPHAVIDPATNKRVFPDMDQEGVPVCVKFNLGAPRHWQGHCGVRFRDELLPFNLWKCQMNYWLLVEGVTHEEVSDGE
jgi:hypothetical protein